VSGAGNFYQTLNATSIYYGESVGPDSQSVMCWRIYKGSEKKKAHIFAYLAPVPETDCLKDHEADCL